LWLTGGLACTEGWRSVLACGTFGTGHDGTKPWHVQTVAPSGEFFYEGAAITGTSGATVIAALLNPGDKPGNVEYFSQAFGTTSWNEQTVAPKCC
jgi:hypothetical protein